MIQKRRFQAIVHRLRYEHRAVNLLLSHSYREDGLFIIVIWQDARLKKHTELITATSPAKLMGDKAKCLNWLNN